MIDTSHEVARTQNGENLLKRYLSGEAVRDLAHELELSQTTVRKQIKEQQLERVLSLSIEYVDCDEFHANDADANILTMEPLSESPSRGRKNIPASLPPYLAVLYETPLLTPEQERFLFRKYNFLKLKAHALRSQLDLSNPSMRHLDKIDRLYSEALQVQKRLAKANMRLVVSLVKKYVSPTVRLPELISEGNVALLKSIEKFDYSRGFKFSTYATWAIINGVRRSVPRDMTQASRFQTSRDEALHSQRDYRVDPAVREASMRDHQQTVNHLLKYLDPREKKVISNRFGLDYQTEPKTLQEIGDLLGVSKERARQLERRALDKLRDAVGPHLDGVLA